MRAMVNYAELAVAVTAAGGVLAIVGGGLKWLLSWLREGATERRKTREMKLGAWSEELDRREKDFEARADKRHAEIANRLEQLEHEHLAMTHQYAALRLAFDLVASALRDIDPANGGLRRAEELLRAAYPLDARTPRSMGALLSEIDRRVSE